ncbi:MAG TPA: PQQ-binding-like beta-propeller repeat protein [Candidatus Angelobacter sp.]|nr:PQQ-binding-like beta-propeller repeat protein [Candidatus Angelobacter sp.]
MRWWPAFLVLASAGLAIFYFLVIREDSRQWRNLDAMVTCIAAVLLLLLWMLFLSRLRWKVRLLLSGSVAGLIGLAVAMFRIHGVTGDLLPIFRFRWSRPPSSTLLSPGGKIASVRRPAAPDASISSGNEFSQFLGPHRNAVLPDGPALARDWKAQPPVKLWRQPIGAGWSGFAIAGDRAVTQEQRGEEELVVCYELLTGRPLWSHADKARYFTTLAGEGPRATPAIKGDKVVTLGSTGILNCLDLASGRGIWSRNIVADNSSRAPEWGVAGSPLVLDDLVIVNPGGKDGRSLVAYRLSDGAFAWGGGDDNASYSSPCVATISDVRQILIFNQHAIFGHAAVDGKVLWRHPWDSHQPHVALPVVLDGNRVFVSSGYGVGSELLVITRDSSGIFSAARLWKTNRLKSKFNNVVTRNGYVYGLDDGILCCLDLSTGELKWKDGRYGHGQFLLVRDALLITAENGDIVLVDPVPTERRELTKFRALDGKTWNPPALVGDLLLVRNDQEAACYRLPLVR